MRFMELPLQTHYFASEVGHGTSTISKVSQPPLVDKLLQYGQMAFNPELPKETRQLNQPKFSTLIER